MLGRAHRVLEVDSAGAENAMLDEVPNCVENLKDDGCDPAVAEVALANDIRAGDADLEDETCDPAVAGGALLDEDSPDLGADPVVAVPAPSSVPEPSSAPLVFRVPALASHPEANAYQPQLRLRGMSDCKVLDKLLKLVRSIQAPHSYVGYSAFVCFALG